MKAAPTAAPSNESASESMWSATSPLTGRFIDPDRNCDARSFTGTNTLKITPIAKPVSVSLSGSNFVSASVKINPSSRNENAQYFTVESVNPKYQYEVKNSAPVNISMTKYLGEIGALQCRQRPRKTSQLSTGRLS